MDNHFGSIPEPVEDSATEPAPPEPAAGAPVADAGADDEVRPLDTVTLDGSRSQAPSGSRIVEHEWTVVSRPDGSTAELEDDGAERPRFFADLAGDYVFALTVADDEGRWDETPDEVVITAKPADGFYVELSWDTATDLDLHLAEDDAPLFTNGDCSYCNMTPNFGGSGVADDASLDADAIDGWGPETITIDDPSAGLYTIRVHFYGEDGSPTCPGGCPETMATVRVFLGGVEAQTFRQQMGGQGSLWEVAAIEWPSGRVEERDDKSRTSETTCR